MADALRAPVPTRPAALAKAPRWRRWWIAYEVWCHAQADKLRARADATAEEIDARTRAARRAKLNAHALVQDAGLDHWEDDLDGGPGDDDGDEPPDGWVPYADHLAQIDQSHIPAAGRWARFEYVDVDGVITARDIVRWEKRGRYVIGFDRGRREERTFRQDRISEWTCG